MTRRTKQDAIDEIVAALGVADPPKVSTGSTEPREIFDLVSGHLGIVPNSRQLTKPELAKAIVEASGSPWLPTFESRGGTVTLAGLEAVLKATRFFCGVTPRR